eukprot:CAMPEP_0117449522 /NCGR_PEP_ID=MMETSP0759-20121206/7989_1 /TAXON_ID=63605 /ORGANISM="Percolomonas cosmopolitus, Strain WS" /LENGTH=737 /DNA_ID=CAMNT_0005242001 /DNA_START=1763 /DNA_END=3976 /DNA_ORIENTATION=-
MLQYALHLCAFYTIITGIIILSLQYFQKKASSKQKTSSDSNNNKWLSVPLVMSEVCYAAGILLSDVILWHSAAAGPNGAASGISAVSSSTGGKVFSNSVQSLIASVTASHSYCVVTRMALHGGRILTSFFSLIFVADLFLSIKYPLSYAKKHQKMFIMMGLMNAGALVWFFFQLMKREANGAGNNLTHQYGGSLSSVSNQHCRLRERSHFLQFYVIETLISTLYTILSSVLFYMSFKFLRMGLPGTRPTRYTHLIRIFFFTMWYAGVFFTSLPLHVMERFFGESPESSYWISRQRPETTSRWLLCLTLLGEISIAFRGVGLCVFFFTERPVIKSMRWILERFSFISFTAPTVNQSSLADDGSAQHFHHSNQDDTAITVTGTKTQKLYPTKNVKPDPDLGACIRKDMMYCVVVGITTTLRGEGKRMVNPKTDFDSAFRYKSIKCNDYDFQFTEYCPNAFSSMRSFMQISNKEFKQSFKPETVVNDLVKQNFSSAKGGSFFCFTADKKYIIKTVTSGEKKILIKILKPLYKHVLKNPNTLINYPLGCYKLHGDKLPFRSQFIVMRNVFDLPKNIDLDMTFDLKGSFIDRTSKAHESVKKDSDLKKVFQLDDSDYYELKRQLGKDSEFFQKQNIMDYSLLLGVHKRNKSKRQKRVKEKIEEPFHRRFKNGMITWDHKYILYMGVIDILQEYNWNKKTERFLKSTFKRRDKDGISSIPSDHYAFRFKKNIIKHFKRSSECE